MSESGSYESAKEENNDANESSLTSDESDDEPLVAKKSASPKKSPLKTPVKGKRGRPSTSNKKEEKKKGRVSFDLVKPDTAADKEEEYEVDSIVGHRQYNGKLMYKIRWKNYGPMDDTWESYDSLSCPDILESYNFKHSIVVPKSVKKGSKKRKAAAASPSKKTNSKKRRSSVDETDDDEEDEVGYADASDDQEEYEVDKILQMRLKKDGTREFLVHWKRWSSHYDTWEPEANLSCPEIIEKFMKQVDQSKHLNAKELRAHRKHTQHFTLNTHDSGRRLSKRNNKKMRVTYYGDTKSDED